MPKWIFVNFVILLLLFTGTLCAHEPGSAKYVCRSLPAWARRSRSEDGRKTRRPRGAKGKACKRLHSTRARSSQPATDDTAFYIAYDPHHLYVAFRCYDAEPDKVVNRIVRRGGNIYDSDVISFFMDPHHDHRTGYKFATTPRRRSERCLPFRRHPI